MTNEATSRPPLPVSFLRWYMRGGDAIIFLAISLGMAVFIGQERIISRGELAYWMLITPAIVMPLLRIRQTLENLLFGIARPIAAFGVFSGGWSVLQGDFAAIPPIFLIVWVAGWACRQELRIGYKALFWLTLAFYLAGSIAFMTQEPYDRYPWLMQHLPEPEAATGLLGDEAEGGPRPKVELASPEQNRDGLNINAWGILPGQTAMAFEPWRVSVTPNIATSGIFSLMILLLLARKFRPRPLESVTAVSALYFALLSFVRAVFVSMALFVMTLAILRLLPRHPVMRVASALFMTIGLTLFVAFSPFLLYSVQDWGFVSRMFLRGQMDMSVADIYRQMYRPWLWSEHIKLFWSSPYLMGHGSELATSALKNIINAGHVRSDSVSFLTRMAATYGLPALGLIYFIIERTYKFAQRNDIWAVACISVIVWLMMTWGSVFHPTNGLFVLAVMIMGKGSEGLSKNHLPRLSIQPCV